jgi:glycopeptide antibiotics resistance protein
MQSKRCLYIYVATIMILFVQEFLIGLLSRPALHWYTSGEALTLHNKGPHVIRMLYLGPWN